MTDQCVMYSFPCLILRILSSLLQHHGLEVLALLHLFLNSLNDIGKVRNVLKWVSAESCGREDGYGSRLLVWSIHFWAGAGGMWSTVAVSLALYENWQKPYLQSASQAEDAVV